MTEKNIHKGTFQIEFSVEEEEDGEFANLRVTVDHRGQTSIKALALALSIVSADTLVKYVSNQVNDPVDLVTRSIRVAELFKKEVKEAFFNKLTKTLAEEYPVPGMVALDLNQLAMTASDGEVN